MTAATAYIVSPIDLLPEIPLAIFGLADDAVMVTWLAGSVLAETDRFLEWEARRSSVIPGGWCPDDTYAGGEQTSSRPPTAGAATKGTPCSTTTTSST